MLLRLLPLSLLLTAVAAFFLPFFSSVLRAFSASASAASNFCCTVRGEEDA